MKKKPLGHLYFKFKDVLVLIEHALKSRKFNPIFSQAYNDNGTRKTDAEIDEILMPGLHLVKDRGIYLKSNGKPPLMRWQIEAEFKKTIMPNCKRYKKDLLAVKKYWVNKLPEFIEAQNMCPIEFASKFEYDKFSTPMGVNSCYVIFAEGFNPYIDDFDIWYKEMRRICGGDDFIELIDNASTLDLKSEVKLKPKYIKITMYDDSYTVETTNKKV